MSENRKLVSDLYEFANKGDFAKLAEMFAADQVVVQAPGHPMAGTWIGTAATAATGQFFQALGASEFTVRNIATDGPHRVMALVDIRGIDGDGRPWTTPMVECFWIEGRKVTEVRPFYWNQQVLDAILATHGIDNFRRDVLEK
jgi:ketosteroid isomerase-like protein